MKKSIEKKEQNRVQGYLNMDDYLKFEKKCTALKKTASFVVRDLVRKWIKEEKK